MAAFPDEDYFTKIASIQQRLHEREKRRLELEKELFSYSMSDKRISQIKSAKLRSYLQEICERQTRAKMRNLELLRDVENIETRMKEHACDCGPLHRKKAECMNQITRFMTARKNKELKEYGTTEEVEGAREKPQAASPSSDRRPVTFTDHQKTTTTSSGGSSPATRVHSGLRASRRSPDHLPVHSPKRLPPSGLLKDSKVSREPAAASLDPAAPLSDDISGSNGSPGSRNLSDKHERAPAVLLLPSACALTAAAAAAAGVPFRACDGRPLSPPVTFMTRPEENISSPGGDTTSPMWAAKSSAAESTAGSAGKGRRESVSTPSSSVRLSVSSDSDLSISLTESESELEEDEEEPLPPEGVAYLDTPPPDTRVTPPPERSGSSPHDRSLHRREEESSVHVEETQNPLQFIGDAVPTDSMTERLSHQGLVSLLENIEGRLQHGGQMHIYQNPHVDASKRNDIISLCNSGAALDKEDLESCGAVVLGELPRLSQSMATGGLLTQDLVSARRPNVRHEDISAALPPDGAALWDRWFKHALVLKERRVLSAERLVQLFTPLLLERHATYGHQAKELLRTLLLSRSDEDEEGPSADEEEQDEENHEEEEEEESVSSSSSSRGLPSLHPGDREERRSATPSSAHHPTTIQELQSTEEDSRNQSPVESIPIRETKAYQLLKQSATQERPQSSGEQEERESAPSGINDGDEEDLHSSHQDPYPREETTNSKRFSAIQSKAFWGESDDSNSEIEAALRPQTFSANNDDFDDFYD